MSVQSAYRDQPLEVSPQRAQQLLDIGHSRPELLAAGDLQSFKEGKSRNIVVPRSTISRRASWQSRKVF
jgi:hypothetical protein